MPSLSPDLKSDLAFSSFHILGNDPEIMLLFMISTGLRDIISADSSRIVGPVLSKPLDYVNTFKFDRNVLTNPTLVKGILNESNSLLRISV